MTPNLNILYIGNSPEYFNSIREKAAAFTIIEDSLKAIKYLKTNKSLDAIICQYNLPGNNGLYLLRVARAKQ